jgi:hypothetical protein
VAILLNLLWAACPLAAMAETPGMTLSLHATGAVTEDIQVRLPKDESHSCALLGPAGKEQTLVLAFNKARETSLLRPSDFGYSLSVSGVAGQDWDENQPYAIIQVAIGHKLFVGLHAADPDFHLQVKADSTGATGGFRATHLLDAASHGTIDIEGSWSCGTDTPTQVPEAADVAPNQQQAANPPVASTPMPPPDSVTAARRKTAQTDADSAAQSSQQALRIYHVVPCLGSGCSLWMAAETQSGRVFKATVSFGDVRISRPLIRLADEGRIELWITGEHTFDANGRNVITARRLDGVAPR